VSSNGHKASHGHKASNGDKTHSKQQKAAKEKYHLRLFVTGQTSRSTKSVENLKRLCDKYLKDRYELEVIDIYQQPAMASENQIIAAPTLIKRLPLPLRRLVGDFSNQDRVLLGLDLRLA
jgi:circadian clock protein KaiB